jgi:type I restriction enzyme S subunit
MGNLDHDTIDLDLSDIQRVTPPQDSEGTRTRVAAGDILISITADVGMVGLVPEDFEEAYINQHVALARPFFRNTSLFLAWFLASKSGQIQFKELQRGATKVGLGLDDIKAVDVPLPPILEQNAILAEVERRLSIVAGAETQVDANLRRADRLRQSILKQAFSGQLVPQDPNDEPASVLLERIRTNASVGADRVRPDRVTRKAGASVAPLRRPRPHTEPVPAVSNKFACLDDVTAAILAAMQPGRQYSRAEIADTLCLSTGRWNTAIQDLKRCGKVLKVGEKRGARYELVKTDGGGGV